MGGGTETEIVATFGIVILFSPERQDDPERRGKILIGYSCLRFVVGRFP